jgi:hypothetical protein
MTGPSHIGLRAADTESFFDLHLPRTRHRCIARLRDGKFVATFHADNRRAVTKARAFEASGTGDVYFGCAAYADPSLGRKGHNVSAVRSCWLDIDTRESKPDAPYADKSEAKVALATFCCEADLPSPTLVDSGNGLHVYWPIEEDITPDDWRRIANLLKWAALKAGLKVDPSRTTDIASVLRVPGTDNRKDPDKPRPVQLVWMGEPTSHAHLYAALVVYAGAEAASGRLLPDNFGLSSNLMVSPNYLPSDAYRIADRCAVIRHFRDTGGIVSEPLWHAALGVLVHTIQGDAVCHEWSRGHPNYSESETQAKIDRLRAYGPTTCVRLGSLSAGLCRGCSYRQDA